MTIGKNIREARNAAGLSQAALGRKMGVTASAVCQFEKATNMRYETIEYIAEALNMKPSALINNELQQKSEMFNELRNAIILGAAFYGYNNKKHNQEYLHGKADAFAALQNMLMDLEKGSD